MKTRYYFFEDGLKTLLDFCFAKVEEGKAKVTPCWGDTGFLFETSCPEVGREFDKIARRFPVADGRIGRVDTHYWGYYENCLMLPASAGMVLSLREKLSRRNKLIRALRGQI